MPIKQTMSETTFVDEIRNDPYANWTVEGAKLLFEHLEELSYSIGEDFEFDPVALRCEFDEYSFDEWGGSDSSTVIAAAEEYGWEIDQDDPNQRYQDALEFLQDRTYIVIGKTTMIMQQF